MLKKITSAIILSLSLIFASAQSSSFVKESTISSGLGIAGINRNLKNVG